MDYKKQQRVLKKLERNRIRKIKKRVRKAPTLTEAILMFTRYDSVEKWKSSLKYQTNKELAMQINGPHCSCCNDMATDVFVNGTRESDISGSTLENWNPICHYHQEYIRKHANRLVTHLQLFRHLVKEHSGTASA